MALTVSSSLNQKTWDATVRVTGGHPNQLWGIGAVQQSAEGEKLTVDRVLVRDAEERMVGYAQLQIRAENGKVHAEGSQAHVNRPATVPGFLQTLAGYVEDRYSAESLTISVDTPAVEQLKEALESRGWKRQETGLEESAIGPRRLRVPLGATEKALSSRLSPDTLERCRSGLKVSDVAVREITASSGGVRAVGLKTGQINHLLKDLGQDSLLLVAARERPDEQPEALGYLWFVHTVGLAMLYRVGFTRKARELGIDDALLLTGAVELQKRGVQRMDGGDSTDKDVPTVLRELADRERTVLGTWRKELVETPETPAAPVPSEPKKRRWFGREKSEVTAAQAAPAKQPAPPPKRVDEVRQQVSQDLGIVTTGLTPPVREVTDSTDSAAGALAGTTDSPGTGTSSETGQPSVTGGPSETGEPTETDGSSTADRAAATEKSRKRGRSDRGADGPRPGDAGSTDVVVDAGAGESVPAVEAMPAGQGVAAEHGEGDEDSAAKPTKASARKQRREAKRRQKLEGARKADGTDAKGNNHAAGSGDVAPATIADTPGATEDTSAASEAPDTESAAAAPKAPDASQPEAHTDTDVTAEPEPVHEHEPAQEPELAQEHEPEPLTDADADAEADADSEADAEPTSGDSRSMGGRADRGRREEPGQELTPEQRQHSQMLARKADSIATAAPQRKRGPLAFGRRLYSESLEAFKDAAGR